jgi:hypothetical protein
MRKATRRKRRSKATSHTRRSKAIRHTRRSKATRRKAANIKTRFFTPLTNSFNPDNLDPTGTGATTMNANTMMCMMMHMIPHTQSIMTTNECNLFHFWIQNQKDVKKLVQFMR